MAEWGDRLTGLIFMLGGVYCVLCGYHVLPRNPKDPEKAQLRHKKYSKVEKIMGFILIVYGILELIGWWSF